MNKPVVLTGLRANNELHIGNYFGALLPMVDMAKNKSKDYQINLFIPDLHSITTPIEYKKLQSQIMQNLKLFAAAGLPLDNPDVHIYRQSYIPAHSELTWILDCFTGFGEMNRMTQFKDKKDETKEVSVGLFNYPVLMAADILLYGAEYVPVGDDQTQHLEFTRDIAQRMNNKFGNIFTIPKPVSEQHKFFAKDQGLRIKDLANPEKKMSKSTESDKGVIFLQDKPEEARKKVMAATTDSVNKVQYEPKNQPGVSNLIEIYGLMTGKSANEAERDFAGQTQYGQFKQAVADKVAGFLEEFQSDLAKVSDEKIAARLKESEEKMKTQANEILYKVQKAVGLR